MLSTLLNIIKNLDFVESEIRNTEITRLKVQALLKDGLCLSDIALKSVERKMYGDNAKSTGLIIIDVEKCEDIKEIMKNKRNLKTIDNMIMFILKMTCHMIQEISTQQCVLYLNELGAKSTTGSSAIDR